MSFDVPVCATCGHAQGDHASAGASFPHPPVYGVCLTPGCTCPAFVADELEERLMRAWLSDIGGEAA